MDIDQLRKIQAPLKAHYRDDPSSAVITARAEATVNHEEITSHVPTFPGVTIAGLHPAAGGDGSSACSANMLMEALASCAGVTLAAVAKSMRIPIKAANVIAEGNYDIRGTLAIDREVPVGLTDITLTFDIRSSAPVEPGKLEKLIELTERYCVVYQTLTKPPAVKRRLDVIQEP